MGATARRRGNLNPIEKSCQRQSLTRGGTGPRQRPGRTVESARAADPPCDAFARLWGSARIPAAEPDPGSVRPGFDPVDEAGDLGMCGEGFDRVELALELLVGKGGMDVGVAGAAEQGDAVLDVTALEVALVTAIAVTSLGNQMVAGEFANLSRTQLAYPTPSNSTAIFHPVTIAK